MTLEEQLQEAYQRAAERAPVPPGAYERFLRRRARRGRVVAAAAGLALVAVLGAAVLVAGQLPQERAPAAPTGDAAELANRAAAVAAARSVPTPRPQQWVYTKELERLSDGGGGKPFTYERWVRVDGKKTASAINNDLRAARVSDTRRQRQLALAIWPRCPPGKRAQLARVRPAVGLGRFFPDPAAVPTDPDGLLAAVYQLVEDPACGPILGDNVQDRAFKLIDVLLEGVLPAEVRAALYRVLPRIPGVTVVQGASDAAGRRGVALARAASIESSGSSSWLRLEVILDRDSYRYLGARYVVTRDHFTPNVGPRSKGSWSRKGQVLISRAQVALAVVDAPCQRPGQATTCAS